MQIELRTSRTRKILLLLVCIGFALTSAYFAFIEPIQVSRFRGSLFILNFCGDCTQTLVILLSGAFILFSCYTLLGIKSLFNSLPNAIISEKGIQLLALGLDRVPWDKVVGVRLSKVGQSKFLNVYVVEEDHVVKKLSVSRRILSLLSRREGYLSFSVPLYLCSRKTKELIGFIEGALRLQQQNPLT